jgi:ribosomal protein S18 acetylase RimI-like enzyme
LTEPFEIRAAAGARDMEVVRALFLEYGQSLGFSLCFQGFDQELAGLPGAYAPPAGALVLAEAGGEAIGVVGLRPLGERICEMKRLYVRQAGRGLGCGRGLAEAVVAAARRRGYLAMRLDTLDAMERAQALHRALGFREIEPYYENPLPGARYFELTLRPSA